MPVEPKFIDIKNAVSFLQTVDAVDANKIAGLGSCASADYIISGCIGIIYLDERKCERPRSLLG
jgi:hypothetical protein